MYLSAPWVKSLESEGGRGKGKKAGERRKRGGVNRGGGEGEEEII